MITLKDYIKKGFYTVSHPVAGFGDFQEKKSFSYKYSFLLFVIFFIVQVLSMAFTGFAFNTSNNSNFDIGLKFVQIAGVAFLWTISNWAISTLFDGSGKVKQIFFVTCVALIPYTFVSALNIILSNVLVENEVMFMTVLTILGVFWSVCMLIVGLMIVHDYTLVQVVLSCLASIFAIAIILCVGLLFYSLFRQLFDFVVNIIMELSYRI